MSRKNFSILGSSNHATRAKNDFYATHPVAVKALLSETACGAGHLSRKGTLLRTQAMVQGK